MRPGVHVARIPEVLDARVTVTVGRLQLGACLRALAEVVRLVQLSL